MRQTAIKAARNGYFYVWDRATGEMVNEPWPFVYVDFMTGSNMETGRPIYDIDKMMFTNVEDRRSYTQAGVLSRGGDRAPGGGGGALRRPRRRPTRSCNTGTEVSWCPGIAARNWENDAYSPQTGLLYTATQTECRTMRVVEGTATRCR